MTGIDTAGLDQLARALTAAAGRLRDESTRTARAVTGLRWSSGVSGRFTELTGEVVTRASHAADDLERIAGGLRQQRVALDAAEAVAVQAALIARAGLDDLAGAARDAEHLASGALHALGSLL